MAIDSTVLVYTCAVLMTSSGAVDIGFSLLYTSNDDVILDSPIRFHKALPFPLKGSYVKNGFGRYGMGSRKVVHVFDGYAKLHKLQFNGTHEVFYSTDFVKSDFYRDSVESGDIADYILFDGADPPFGYFKRLLAIRNGIDNPNVNVVEIKENSYSNKRVHLAVSDYWKRYSYNLTSLATIGVVRPRLPKGGALYDRFPVPSSAHPVQEYATDHLLTYYSLMSLFPGVPHTINVVRMRSLGDIELLAEIRRDELPYMHSLGATKNYVIILAHPLFIDMYQMIKTGSPFKSLTWKPEVKTDIYLVHLRTRKVIRVQTEAHFNMHFVNAYEQGDSIVIDMVTYPNLTLLDNLLLENMFTHEGLEKIINDAALVRYRINLGTGTAKVTPFRRPKHVSNFINSLDMPIINERFRYRRYCYVYGTVQKTDGVHPTNSSLVKNTICDASGSSDRYWVQEDQYPGEPWFIQRPGARAEDDGILISIVLDGPKKLSYVLVLDARTFKEISRAYLPSYVPFSLHGRYFPV